MIVLQGMGTDVSDLLEERSGKQRRCQQLYDYLPETWLMQRRR